MNTIAQTARPALQPLLSAHLRFAAVIAVAVAMALAWAGAEQASRQAVQTAAQSFDPATTRITLPSVEVVGRREATAMKVRSAG